MTGIPTRPSSVVVLQARDVDPRRKASHAYVERISSRAELADLAGRDEPAGHVEQLQRRCCRAWKRALHREHAAESGIRAHGIERKRDRAVARNAHRARWPKLLPSKEWQNRADTAICS